MRLLGGTHLSSCVHVGAMLDELSHHLHMALLRGQMESVQTILEIEKRSAAGIRNKEKAFSVCFVTFFWGD